MGIILPPGVPIFPAPFRRGPGFGRRPLAGEARGWMIVDDKGLIVWEASGATEVELLILVNYQYPVSVVLPPRGQHQGPVPVLGSNILYHLYNHSSGFRGPLLASAAKLFAFPGGGLDPLGWYQEDPHPDGGDRWLVTWGVRYVERARFLRGEDFDPLGELATLEVAPEIFATGQFETPTPPGGCGVLTEIQGFYAGDWHRVAASAFFWGETTRDRGATCAMSSVAWYTLAESRGWPTPPRQTW